jgi:phage terminase large subunit-like protein
VARTKHPHCQAAEKYARDVVAGRVLANAWVRAACERHLNDRKREKRRDWPYKFNREKAERVCRFIELLPHTKGKWARDGERLVLEPWQKFLICVLFGWLRKRDGLRRFRKVFWLIPRKNGKSALAAAIGLYMLAADKEYGAEVYSGATTEKQAWEVFRPAKLMAQRTPAFQKRFGVQVNAQNLHIDANGSRFEPLIGKPGDGSSPSCAIHDEYHEHQTDEQVDAMETGMGAREQPIQLIITTAGENLEGPCYQAQLDAQKVLEGAAENEQLFACIWGVDADDDWTSEDALRKANPNYDVSVSGDFLRAQQREAINNGRKQGTFKTKHLNVWVGSREAYFNVEKWIRCGDDQLSPADFAGQPCKVGLDLASKVDIAAMELVFDLQRCDDTPVVRRLREAGRRYVRFGCYWLPEATVEEPDNEHYRGWVNDGWISVTDGEIIDFAEIEASILDAVGEYQVEEVAYDPHQATMLVTRLQEQGVPVVEVRPTVLNFSEPMKQLDAITRAGQVVHNGDPVMTWMVSNVTAKTDAKDNVYPRKERDSQKIDGVVAHLMALARWMADEGDPRSVYETRGVLTIDV